MIWRVLVLVGQSRGRRLAILLFVGAGCDELCSSAGARHTCVVDAGGGDAVVQVVVNTTVGPV